MGPVKSMHFKYTWWSYVHRQAASYHEYLTDIGWWWTQESSLIHFTLEMRAVYSWKLTAVLERVEEKQTNDLTFRHFDKKNTTGLCFSIFKKSPQSVIMNQYLCFS